MISQKKIKDYIKNEKWWTEEAPSVLQLCVPFMRGFVNYGKFFGGPSYKIAFMIQKNNILDEKTLEKDKREFFEYLLAKFKKDPSFVWHKIKKWLDRKNKLVKYHAKLEKVNLKEYSNKKLWQEYDNFYHVYMAEFWPPIATESCDPFTDKDIIEIFKKETKVSPDQVSKYLSIMTYPLLYSFIEKERMDFLNLCLEYLKLDKRPKNIKQVILNYPKYHTLLKKHSRKYFWIRNNYKDTPRLEAKDFLEFVIDEIKSSKKKKIQDELKRLKTASKRMQAEKKKAIKKLKISQDLRKTLKFLEIMAWWQDQRKHMVLISNHYINEFLKEISRRSNYTLRQIQYFMPEEIKKLLLQNKKTSKKVLQERRKRSVYITYANGETLITGMQAKKIEKWFEDKEEIKELNGYVASRIGKVVYGHVKIITDPAKGIFNAGEILVAPMTRPEYLPLMRKAKAVITNEGGITTHAAIVSREMGIPCIIGTKYATKVLKNGDKVKIDMEKGKVEKIESN